MGYNPTKEEIMDMVDQVTKAGVRGIVHILQNYCQTQFQLTNLGFTWSEASLIINVTHLPTG